MLGIIGLSIFFVLFFGINYWRVERKRKRMVKPEGYTEYVATRENDPFMPRFIPPRPNPPTGRIPKGDV